MGEQIFLKLEVWQKSMDMVASIYSATKTFPKDELYGLTSQIRRAAVSIPSNIAEGRARRTTREYMRFVSIACGSAAELETQIMLGEKLGYLELPRARSLLDEVIPIARMLNKLYSSLENKTSTESA